MLISHVSKMGTVDGILYCEVEGIMETAKIEIKVPKEMAVYLINSGMKDELERNAMIL